MAAICRFCLHDKSTKSNPFLSPCACTGSGKYVHKVCLETWQQITHYADNKIRCQLCLQNYILPRKWPLEILPLHNFVWAYLLSNNLLVTAIIHYAHFLSLIYIYPIFVVYQGPTTITFILHSKIGLITFYVSLFFITVIYGTYYYKLCCKIINYDLYISYSYKQYLITIFALGICLFYVQFTIFPFGGMYIYLLCYFNKIHIQTLELININGII